MRVRVRLEQAHLSNLCHFATYFLDASDSLSWIACSSSRQATGCWKQAHLSNTYHYDKHFFGTAEFFSHLSNLYHFDSYLVIACLPQGRLQAVGDRLTYQMLIIMISIFWGTDGRCIPPLRIVLKKRMERQRSREWTHAMHGLPDLWGVFDEQCQRRGIRMAKLCSILRNSMLNVEEQGGGAPGNKQKGVVRNCGMGRYHHGTLRCS